MKIHWNFEPAVVYPRKELQLSIKHGGKWLHLCHKINFSSNKAGKLVFTYKEGASRHGKEGICS
jgi:hypothetical protein